MLVVCSTDVTIAEPINPSSAPSGERQLRPRPIDEVIPSSVGKVATAKYLEPRNNPHRRETIMPNTENDFPGLPLLKIPMNKSTSPPNAVRIPSPSRPVTLRERPRKSLVIEAQGMAAPTINKMLLIMMSVFDFISCCLSYIDFF